MSCDFTIATIETLSTSDLVMCFADLHGTAIALCIIFAFVGAVWFAPRVIK